MAAKKTSKASKPHVNKSEFIRKHPDMPVPELIALAKKTGITLSPGFIYTLRSEQRKKGTPTKATPTKKAPTASQKASPPKGFEAAFVAAIVELGARGAEELFRTTLVRMRSLAK